MAINPITYTEKVIRSFLKYQLTAYPFADTRLHSQMRDLLNMDAVRHTPLLKGPYISLARSFRKGVSVSELISDGIFHSHMTQIIPSNIESLYGHQERAIRSIHSGKTTLVSTGTGSGKTEAYLYPIISKCLKLKDSGEQAGVSAVIVYPMNALAEDQLERLRGLLAGSGVTFGMYVGKTPEYEREVSGYRLREGSSRADYEEVFNRYREQGRPDAIHPFEEVCSREVMRTSGRQPRILLTNVKMLELLLTRGVDIELFDNARLDFMVFDEAHTFTGIQGAESACLIRRLKKFCNLVDKDVICIATSATIVDERDPDAAKKFASRFFGIPMEKVECVHEEYEADPWEKERTLPPIPQTDIKELLSTALKALDLDNPDAEIRNVYQQLTHQTLPDGTWKETLHNDLIKNELAYQINKALGTPYSLDTLINDLSKNIEREVSEEELVLYLALGAVAAKQSRPVFRPVVHGFIRGISGAVVTFPMDAEIKLWLSSEDEIASQGGKENMWRAPVHTCTTCGQHYFETYLRDFKYTASKPEGGQIAEAGDTYWEALDKDHSGIRAVFVDQVISQDEDENLEQEDWSFPLYFCRHCGTAHNVEVDRCRSCAQPTPPVRLYAVRSNTKSIGYLSSCISCGANGRRIGRRYREPMRPVRAITVSDVHILAQDMVHHAERQRLLLFADNRQDAAFQAGWMKDHARRFRLRSLMAETMKDGPLSIGDMVIKIDNILDESEGLSRALIPEVWRVVPKEGSGGMHEDERRHFLRIQVLREITTAARQQIGLEPWGRLKVSYQGIDSGSGFIQKWSNTLKIPPEDLKGGIETLLDQHRRQRKLHDSFREIFSRWWNDGDREIQRGYMPLPPGPGGIKLELEAGDDKQYVKVWLAERMTLVRQIVQKWGVKDEDIPTFLNELWDYLRGESIAILIPVTLKGSRGRALPNCSGVYQINGAKLILSENHGSYRCKRCRRKVSRRSPHDKCMAWRCDGELEFIAEDPDNYDLQLLDERYSMLRPEEHTAMVPSDVRERIENWFKGSSDRVNTLVCTPTLELGVDIGALDSVLLRNVPPLPANYWQRSGRAGRRHRMAVNLTYCRPVSHDRAYYNEPLKLLTGKVDPPAFNLRNDVMISKHVHAAVITYLFQISREGSGLSEQDRTEITETLRQILPRRISAYLFETSGQVRTTPFDIGPFKQIIQKHQNLIFPYVKEIFQKGWPGTDTDVTKDEELEKYVNQMTDELAAVLIRLRKRLQWAHNEIRRLNQVRHQYGTLESEDEAHYKRCDKLIKKLKGTLTRQRGEAEGVDDINTYSVLAAEGFLPGYGLDTGAILGMAEVPFWQLGSMDFVLPRPTGMALREYVPGNLIYANGHRFVARRFHRDPDEERNEMPMFEVNLEREAISETSVGQGLGGLGSGTIRTISVCDVDLIHQSQISDEEETRFQMPVVVYGREKGRHNGGTSYSWGERNLTIRRNVHLNLVNVGSSPAIESRSFFGYPICTVCGQSISPLSSDRQIDHFIETHSNRCGRKPEMLGFFANVYADCLMIPSCESRVQAYSVMEAIRIGAAHILDMHLEDLQVLVIGHVDRDEVDGYLWDPMPGGSGLFVQIRENFPKVIGAALEILNGCPSACDFSCIDCMQNFRNGYYHKNLDRHAVIEFVEQCGQTLKEDHPIPPVQPTTRSHDPAAQPVNDAETKLKHLLEAAGLTSGKFQQQISFKEKITLDHQIGSTTPDVFYRCDEDDEDDKGMCIYLDGMSASLHGDPATAERDREIRSWLRNTGYQVVEITALELDDRNAMIRHFKKIARYLSGREMANKISEDIAWFEHNKEGQKA